MKSIDEYIVLFVTTQLQSSQVHFVSDSWRQFSKFSEFGIGIAPNPKCEPSYQVAAQIDEEEEEEENAEAEVISPSFTFFDRNIMMCWLSIRFLFNLPETPTTTDRFLAPATRALALVFAQ